MSGKFSALKQGGAASTPATPAPTPAGQTSRDGKKAMTAYFSPELAMAMKMTAMKNGMNLQTAMAEAFNDWLRKMGESPVGE